MLNSDVITYSQKKYFALLTFPREQRELNSCLVSKINMNYGTTSSGCSQPTLPDTAQRQGKRFPLSTRGQVSPTHSSPSSSSPWGQQLPSAGMENVLLRERHASFQGDKRYLVILNEHFSLHYCF